MAENQQPTTAETSISKTKAEIIKEAKRIEEALLYSSKGHFAAAHGWANSHLWLGVPVVILSGIAGASALTEFDHSHIAAGLISLLVVGLSSLLTFLNPNERAATHLKAGNNYDALMNKVRIFWSIDCGSDESEEILTKQLKSFSDQKSKLNNDCPQVPRWAYKIAQRGINNGEGDYMADKK